LVPVWVAVSDIYLVAFLERALVLPLVPWHRKV